MDGLSSGAEYGMLLAPMPWYSKEQPTPFDNTPILGLEFLNGDALAKRSHLTWLAGRKYPLISFPSGMMCEVQLDASQEKRIHIFGQMSVPYQATIEDAYAVAQKLATEHGYFVGQSGNHRLLVANLEANRAYEITFDE